MYFLLFSSIFYKLLNIDNQFLIWIIHFSDHFVALGLCSCLGQPPHSPTPPPPAPLCPCLWFIIMFLFHLMLYKSCVTWFKNSSLQTPKTDKIWSRSEFNPISPRWNQMCYDCENHLQTSWITGKTLPMLNSASCQEATLGTEVQLQAFFTWQL